MPKAAFAVPVMMRQGHPSDRAGDNRQGQQRPSHDCSSDRTEAFSPLGNKDVGGGEFCDRADENPEQIETLPGEVSRAGGASAGTADRKHPTRTVEVRGG
jgi:hypothetical protein